MTRLSDASDIAPWPLWTWVALAAFAVVAYVLYTTLRNPTPVIGEVPPVETVGCNEVHPHVMVPTDLGWRCARDCGEAWYVDEADTLAEADLAFWEIENGWAEV